MAEDEDVLGGGIEKNAVGAALHVDGLDWLEGLGVEHDDRIGACKSVAGFGIDGDAVNAVGVGDGADGLEGIEIVNIDTSGPLTAARDIEFAGVGIGKDVVPPACAADLVGFDDLIGLSGRRLVGEGRHAERRRQGH